MKKWLVFKGTKPNPVKELIRFPALNLEVSRFDRNLHTATEVASVNPPAGVKGLAPAGVKGLVYRNLDFVIAFFQG